MASKIFRPGLIRKAVSAPARDVDFGDPLKKGGVSPMPGGNSDEAPASLVEMLRWVEDVMEPMAADPQPQVQQGGSSFIGLGGASPPAGVDAQRQLRHLVSRRASGLLLVQAVECEIKIIEADIEKIRRS